MYPFQLDIKRYTGLLSDGMYNEHIFLGQTNILKICVILRSTFHLQIDNK